MDLVLLILAYVSAAYQFDFSRVTGPSVSLLLEQDPVFPVNGLNEQLALKQEIHLENRCRCGEVADTLHPLLPLELQRAREFACLKGASSWLTVLPLDEHGFPFTKVTFVMLFVSAMVGHCFIFQQSVFVAPHLLLTMPSLVLMVVIRLFATMRLGTSLLS